MDRPVDGWVLYDGACGFCTWWVRRWRAVLRHRGLDVAPLQAPWVVERLGLDPDEAVRDIRLLTADGRRLAGGDVYREVMRRIWWAYPCYLLASAPGIRAAFDGAYRAFADHRQRFSRACRLPPPDHGPGS